MKTTTTHSSDILLELASLKELKGELTFQHILQVLGERAFGIVLLFFALPSALPFSTIPGISVVFSLPIALFACQMIFARKTLWLPKIIAKRTIHQKTISKVIHTTVPYLTKIEYFLKPRWIFMTCRLMEIITGIIIFCLAIFLMLPIPLSNFIFAFLLIIFSLGLIEKDGVLLVVGYIGTLVYISFIYVFIEGIIKYLFH
ncbi:exopolysaccharide biosynthesis protein [Legionella anisa]|uniref:Sugar transporter n=1 Tax=Legionella anisa TaxID=28082 RepID=A0AAX0WQE8_9GAMM|nr:exopolysaccharide biosynthesis protein [Legionella anisa]AWN75550.1 sugar transporter [Legionella anisa]KTC76337.1 proton transporter [Legionella anisa]MBN5935951.1 exopolysaccharide biosynthesis protein [Legionella anisa]MCW8424259.1 exopolysaccharide biosynthesis protein [Legionella anisa]MCW8446623.1 exopolysaccharide biosynthesis protein [Legionella anisa]